MIKIKKIVYMNFSIINVINLLPLNGKIKKTNKNKITANYSAKTKVNFKINSGQLRALKRWDDCEVQSLLKTTYTA